MWVVARVFLQLGLHLEVISDGIHALITGWQLEEVGEHILDDPGLTYAKDLMVAQVVSHLVGDY